MPQLGSGGEVIPERWIAGFGRAVRADIATTPKCAGLRVLGERDGLQHVRRDAHEGGRLRVRGEHVAQQALLVIAAQRPRVQRSNGRRCSVLTSSGWKAPTGAGTSIRLTSPTGFP